jgi:outer membrane murein-binding lipoprotein Lpp
MNKSKITSTVLMTALILGASLMQGADDKNKPAQAAKQAQQQQVKRDTAQYNAKYSNKQVRAGSAEAAQAKQERAVLKERQKKAKQ